MQVMSGPEIPTVAFTRDEAQAAHEDWGCNCGPAALAAVLHKRPADVRAAFDSVGFPARRYTSPSMMEKAVPLAGGKIIGRNLLNRNPRRFPLRGLARIQWTGPWTAEGTNPKWRYRQTHWVASWAWDNGFAIFDVNGGMRSLDGWVSEIVPWILSECVPRADGGWYVTHSWEIGRNDG